MKSTEILTGKMKEGIQSDWDWTIKKNHSMLNSLKIFRGASRWWKSKTWRSPSSPQTHQKYIYMWNSFYRTPTERWQKTSDLPKGNKLPMYLGRAKEKTKTKE